LARAAASWPTIYEHAHHNSHAEQNDNENAYSLGTEGNSGGEGTLASRLGNTAGESILLPLNQRIDEDKERRTEQRPMVTEARTTTSA